MRKVMHTVEETSLRIRNGERLMLAADSRVLASLPRGHWIAGTIPYFMTEDGGRFSRDLILVNELPSGSVGCEIKIYDSTDIGRIYADAPENGITVVVLPASSPTHFEFALNVTKCEAFATRPLIGWVSGTEIGPDPHEKPLIYCGENRKAIEDGAVVMHISLAADKRADINIVNIFRQDQGDTLMFLEDGFSASSVIVNGKIRDLADYIAQRGVDTRFPLVADYFGSMINISFKSIDTMTGDVSFYAPVFRGVEYKLAEPIEDYASLFAENTPEEPAENIFFSCNCILNYLYSKLEGRRAGAITGPVTFGEIAYQLLNQTLVYAVIRDEKS
ncbi:MAG: hypothetical protein A2Z99_02360 [Treponema sp. GWB1_62_6]|nr:MAG: hypothetical protein A2Z99_02360 [Treponema sp. GWB1_62_6]OHE69502.1 MAG: hypothetical protein A2001_19910 [Treponema sp. GWC1_61_84]